MVSSIHSPSHLDTVPAGVSLLQSSEEQLLEALRSIRQLEGLQEEEYLWLIRNSRELSAPAGTRLFVDDEPAYYMTILLTGEIQVRRKKAGQENILIGRSGNLTGLMPFSRMKSVGGTGVVTEDVWALQISKDRFPEMLTAIPSMGQRCVSVLLDRTREVTRLEQQSEKLNALGKLAANLAHELNNPASAAQRAASNLLDELKTYGNVSFHAGRLCLTEQQEQRYMQWCQALGATIKERALQAAPADNRVLEDRLLRWLEERKIADAWSIAPVFAESRIEPEDLVVLDEFLNHEASALALRHYASGLRAGRMTAAVLDSTARIFKLIQAIQQYSHMDQGSLQDVDLAQSLDNTLSMLHYRMQHVKVVREYQCDLPLITANGGELNQIWMALLENALDAMQDKGTIRLSTRHTGDMVQVEIWDDGPGIPPELHTRIFEPFFTTKPVGTAPGLGLDSVRRILTRYKGFIDVQSKPGATCFQVRLPLQQTGAY